MAIRRMLKKLARQVSCLSVAAGLVCVPMTAAMAQRGDDAAADSLIRAPSYVDLVEWASASDLVGVVTIDRQITLRPERAPGLAPGHARLYIEALTQSVLSAPRPIGEELVFLVDVPLDARGKVPKIKKRTFLVFGDLNPEQPRELQLLSSDVMIPIGPEIEDRTRRVLTQLAAPSFPDTITGIKDVISVPGNLAGESETQIFVETQSGAPVSINVIRRPQVAARWGVSLGDIVDPTARPPQEETLAWYQFACHLPRALPEQSFLQADQSSRARAREDYALILSDLGPCTRNY